MSHILYKGRSALRHELIMRHLIVPDAHANTRQNLVGCRQRAQPSRTRDRFCTNVFYLQARTSPRPS
jgi:hypothetical protein